MAETAAAYIAAADMAASTKYPELEQISDPTMMAQQNGVDKDEKCLFPDILILFQVEIILKTKLISRAFSSIFKLRNSKKGTAGMISSRSDPETSGYFENFI